MYIVIDKLNLIYWMEGFVLVGALIMALIFYWTDRNG